MSRLLVALILFLFLNSCNSPKNQTQTTSSLPPKVEVPQRFTLPELTNSQPYDSIKQVEVKWLPMVSPAFAGKYKFGQKIDINPLIRDSTFYFDRTDGARFSSIDTLDTNGFELVVDYKTDVYYNPDARVYEVGNKKYLDSTLYVYYPVYLVNSTDNTKVFKGMDMNIGYGIQEAIETPPNAEWRPIETRWRGFCGNDQWEMLVRPKEFVVLLFVKYKGDFKTHMRVRIKMGESIYISKSFKGKINKKQFQMHSFIGDQMKETKGMAAAHLFYGAMPNEKQWR